MQSEAFARPVSYAGGTTLMQRNDAHMHSVHLHYSPTAHYSLGYKGEYWRERDWQFHGLQANYLAKRWNMPKAQANIYVKSALGVAYSDAGAFDGETQAAGFIGFAADWENRRFFTSYENRATEAGDIDSFFMQKARIGVAPYIGDYGDFHTWFMLQLEHEPESRDHFTLTPLVRVFKDKYLGEFGISEDGDILANVIIRF